jgi:hypothetical protein
MAMQCGRGFEPADGCLKMEGQQRMEEKRKRMEEKRMRMEEKKRKTMLGPVYNGVEPTG